MSSREPITRWLRGVESFGTVGFSAGVILTFLGVVLEKEWITKIGVWLAIVAIGTYLVMFYVVRPLVWSRRMRRGRK